MSIPRRLILMDLIEFNRIWTAMHMIVVPGEYGMGTESGSHPEDDKKAWEKLGELLDELNRTMYQGLYQKHRI